MQKFLLPLRYDVLFLSVRYDVHRHGQPHQVLWLKCRNICLRVELSIDSEGASLRQTAHLSSSLQHGDSCGEDQRQLLALQG